MESYSIKPATEFELAALAELLTRGFEDYPLPIHVGKAELLSMLRRDSVDLNASRILFRGEEAVGLALIARRGWNSRLAAMGIAAHARQQGAGALLLRRLVEEAKTRGEREMTLEVLAQNEAAKRLYQNAGFVVKRNLFGYYAEHPESDSKDALEEIDSREVARQVTYHGLSDLPWQLSGATLANFTPPARAFRLNDAYCLVSDTEASQVWISSLLVKTRSRGAGLGPALLRALFAAFPGKVWRVPILYPEEICFVFEAADMKREELWQHQMALTL